jgi:hypothetical protein
MKSRAILFLAVVTLTAPAGCARRSLPQPEAPGEGQPAQAAAAPAQGPAEAPPAGPPNRAPSNPDLELSVRAPAVCVVAHPCALVLNLKNKSPSKCYFYSGPGLSFQNLRIASPYPEFRYHVVRSAGPSSPLPSTQYGEDVAATRADTTTYMLTPGAELEFPLLLNRVVDLSQPGDYLVTISKDIFTKDSLTFAKKDLFTVVTENVPLKVVGPPD